MPDILVPGPNGSSLVLKDLGGGQWAQQASLYFPIPYGALGHYRSTHRTVLVASQAAGSRLWSVRNNGTNLLMPTRLILKWLLTAAHTAAIEDSLDLFKDTAFSGSDSVNTVTPTASRKRTSMAAAPGGAEIRGLAVAGAAAGMTGGTRTPDSQPLVQLPQWLLAAVPTTALVPAQVQDDFESNGAHPLVLANNEGLELQNRVLLGAAAGSSVYIDFAWAEVASY